SEDTDQNESRESESAELIAELCINTTLDSVKFCLRNYQYGKSLAQIERDFEKERKDTLRETANFLQIPNFQDKTKKALSHLIICRIQNLLPDNCSICKTTYKISLHETTILDCAVCGQGVHKQCWLELASISTEVSETINAEQFKQCYNPLNLPGIFYICNACKPNTIPSEEEGNCKKKKSGAISEDTIQENTTVPVNQNDKDNKDQSQNLNKSNKEENNDVMLLSNGFKNPFDAPWGNPMNRQNIGNGDHTRMRSHITWGDSTDLQTGPKEEHSKIKSRTTCRFFINGNCKHGISGRECNFNHPKLCKKYTHHGTRQPRGCNLGKKCEFLHPKMCFDSMRKGECYSESCRYNHIKGTRRHPPVNKNQTTWRDHTDYTEPNQSANSDQTNKFDSNSFLEVINLMKQEILQNLNQKITTIQTQMQQLQQAHPPQLQTPNTTMVGPQIMLPRPPISYPQMQFHQQ
ncbi:MAG: hypothetical protein ACPHL3_08115, partial [Paracoccaceae bacterium]